MSTNALNSTEAIWTKARERYPDLSALITLEQALFAAQRAMIEFVPESAPVDETSLLSAWRAGEPAFDFDGLHIDMAVLSQVVAWLGGIVISAQDPLTQAEVSWQVSQLAQADPLELVWLARSVYEGKPQGDIENELLAAALKPFLWQSWKTLPAIPDPSVWPHGYCPACGAGPDFASLGDAESPRTLYCSRCDCQWHYRRSGCPFCENTNPRSLAYHPTEDESYRLYICGDCRRYLKTVEPRKLARDILLPLDRAVTFAIDQLAKENGYI